MPGRVVWAVQIVSGFTSCFLVEPFDAQVSESQGSGGFLVPRSFRFCCLLSFPKVFDACAFVSNAVVGKVTQKSRTPLVGWSMCELKDSARDLGVTGFTRPRKRWNRQGSIPCSLDPSREMGHKFSHPLGWMKDSPESLERGGKLVQGSRDARVLFRVTSLGGIQPER